jgi:hypothetical protein
MKDSTHYEPWVTKKVVVIHGIHVLMQDNRHNIINFMKGSTCYELW